MRNFSFRNPTRIAFGRGQIASLGDMVPAGARVLLTFGGGSIKANGTYDQVRAALGGRLAGEFGGIEPNPSLEQLLPGVERIRREGYDFLLAVGGGSVIDGTKFLAAAAPYAGDPWEMVASRRPIAAALPLGTVLTLPGTGSEMNSGCVISRRETLQKLVFGHALLAPQFSVLDPEVTFTLPPRQVANGIVDAFTHVIEQYLTYPADAPLQDRMAEGILNTLIAEGPKTLAQPRDYASRANVMWCATLALNGLIGAGVPQDWASHAIGHELTALYGLDHAQTLAIVLPSLLEQRRQAKEEKLLQYAERVWNLGEGDGPAADRVDEAIARTRGFFEALGVPTTLASYGVAPEAAGLVARRLEARGAVKLGERGDVTPAVVETILQMAA